MEIITERNYIEYSKYQLDEHVFTVDQAVKDGLGQYQAVVEVKNEVQTESKKETGVSKGSILDIDRYPILYHQILEYYKNNPVEAETVLLSIFEEDIRAILWEATKSPLPFTFYYHRQELDDGTIKFVHQSDLHWGRSISEGVSPKFRKGAEFNAINHFQLVANQLKVGESTLIASPKWDESEELGSVPYTDSQMTFVQRMSKDLYFARQFQRESLDRLDCIEVINKFVGRIVLPPEATIQEIVTYIGTRSTRASTNYLINMLAEVTGEPVSVKELAKAQALDEEVRLKSKQKAVDFFHVLKRGEVGVQLEETLSKILIDTAGLENLMAAIKINGDQITISTDCIVLSTRNRRGWMKAGGEAQTNWGFCKGCGGFRLIICNVCNSCYERSKELVITM